VKENRIVVTYDPGEEGRVLLERMLGGSAHLVFLQDIPGARRAPELSDADVLLSWHPSRELHPEEWGEICGVRLIQLISAGADHVPFSDLPPGAEIATNAGAYAEPMAEHVLAMTLALAKHLLVQHDKLSRGEFDQSSPNRTLRGAVCGILGFGGIGRATARLMRGMGARIYALNRSGQSQEPAEFIGTLDDLERVLRASDVLVVALPLSSTTRGLIGAQELGWMKPDAILINVARGEIIDEAALYEHLRTHPNFMAGIDAWWIEPFRYGEFRMDHPFLELPNVLGSPHNSAMIPGALADGLRQAAENVQRFLSGIPITGTVHPEDR
jgi:phosphoglycerate dehydrogenase-like enzyme